MVSLNEHFRISIVQNASGILNWKKPNFKRIKNGRGILKKLVRHFGNFRGFALQRVKNHKKLLNLPETIMVALRGSPMMTARVDPRADRTAADQKSSPVAAGKTRRAPGIWNKNLIPFKRFPNPKICVLRRSRDKEESVGGRGLNIFLIKKMSHGYESPHRYLYLNNDKWCIGVVSVWWQIFEMEEIFERWRHRWTHMWHHVVRLRKLLEWIFSF